MKYTQLVAAVQHVNGASFIGLDTLTEVKLLGGKKNPQQGRITKRMVNANVMAFQNKTTNGYENMVHRRLVAEGKNPASFQLSPRQWGTRVPNMPIVEHHMNDEIKYYLEVIFLKAGLVEYRCDGLVIPEIEIIGLPVVAVSADAQGGLDNLVIVRTFAADSVTELRIDGCIFN